MSPHAIAALVVALSAVGGCTDHEKANAERVFQALGASPVLAETSSGEDEPPTVPEPTYPPQAAIPPHVPQWGDADYACTPQWAVLSCDDQGKPHHIDGGFNWID